MVIRQVYSNKEAGMKATRVLDVLVAVIMATALFGGMVYAEPPVEESGTVDVDGLVLQVLVPRRLSTRWNFARMRKRS